MKPIAAVHTANLYQLHFINATPLQLFALWMDADQHARITGKDATIENKTGGKFVTCDKRISGYNLLLEKNSRIIQAWTHRDFPQHHFSILDLFFESHDKGCYLHMNHYGVPHDCRHWVEEQWKTEYWSPIQTFFDHFTGR